MSAAHVLVVDDDRNNRELLGIILEREGYRVSAAESGEMALLTIAAELPDLVLLDVLMSGIDGYEVAAQLKGAAETRHVPVVLLTGLDDSASRQRLKSSGADALLVKPIDRAKLCTQVRALLTR